MTNQFSLFKSAEAERRYVKAYDAVLELWPVPYRTLRVSTGFGETHVIESGSLESGSIEAPPLLLLPGFGASSTMWVPMIAALSKARRVFAVDTIGDLGRSALTRKLAVASDYSTWLDELMDGLKIEQAVILGFSQGGWIALNFAIAAPQRVEKLILLAPNAGFVPVRPQFLVRLMLMALFPTPSVVDKWARWNSTAWDRHELYYQLSFNQMLAGLSAKSFARSGVMPTTFSDEALRSLSMKVLMLVGEHEIVNDTEAALARARALIPHIEAGTVPNARHMLPYDQPQLVCERVLRFLDETPSPVWRGAGGEGGVNQCQMYAA